MSHSSSPPNPDEIDQALKDLLGGEVAPHILDEAAQTELEFGVLARTMRAMLASAARADGVGIRGLARTLGISPAAVSRHLKSEGDLRISTAALIAHALGRYWSVELKARERGTGSGHSNHFSQQMTRSVATGAYAADVGLNAAISAPSSPDVFRARINNITSSEL